MVIEFLFFSLFVIPILIGGGGGGSALEEAPAIAFTPHPSGFQSPSKSFETSPLRRDEILLVVSGKDKALMCSSVGLRKSLCRQNT